MNLKSRIEKLEAKTMSGGCSVCEGGKGLIIYTPGQEIDWRCEACGGRKGTVALPDNGR